MCVRLNVFIQALNLGERLGIGGRLLEGSELVGVLLIGLVKYLSRVTTILLLQGLHLHHGIVLLLNLLLLWGQYLLLRLLGEGGDS